MTEQRPAPITQPDDSDRPIRITSVVRPVNPGACTCAGVTGQRTAHTTGQPGCWN